MSFKNYFFWAIVVGMVGVVFVLTRPSAVVNEQEPHGMIVSPQGVDIPVIIAETEEQRVLGLSGRTDFPNEWGMLFIFPQAGDYSFWMKGMQFSLDIIWMDETGVVVDRALAVSPESYPKTFVSQAPARYVLEMTAGGADRYGFTVGSRAVIQKQ